MATNFIPVPNSAAEVSPSGRVVRKGIRYNTTGNQPVMNLKVAFKRSYLPKGEGAKWVNNEQYFEFALWGDRANTLKTQLERYGDIATLTETHEIRVRPTFSMADVKIGKPWGGAEGQEARQDLTCTAYAIELISINPNGFNNEAQGEEPVAPIDPPVEFVSF